MSQQPGDGFDYQVEGRSSKLRPIHPTDFAHEPRSDGARPTANDVHDKRRRLASAGFIAGGRRDGVRCEVLPGHIAKAQAPKSAAWRRLAALREVRDVPCPYAPVGTPITVQILVRLPPGISAARKAGHGGTAGLVLSKTGSKPCALCCCWGDSGTTSKKRVWAHAKRLSLLGIS